MWPDRYTAATSMQIHHREVGSAVGNIKKKVKQTGSELKYKQYCMNMNTTTIKYQFLFEFSSKSVQVKLKKVLVVR